MSEEEQQLPAEEHVMTFDMTMKKKKKKKMAAGAFEDADDAAEAPACTAHARPVTGQPGSSDYVFQDYPYQELLSRVFGLIRENNPEISGERKKFSIVPPIIAREGSKKTSFANIADFCRRMSRPVEHLTAFLLTELGTTGNMDGAGRLIIKGRFQQLQVENVLKRYIQEYVTCKTCKAPETHLEKDNTSRLLFIECEKCNSRRSVAPIKTGFKAQTERRSASRV